ncbi:TrbC/VirB2 family protein [Asaia spathodeae]|uniref:TrbC/VirB2 family protein n=1 Tax=Asaia spathodeae TaxID=657016 RepID=A0ABX2P949_9PROT|nr:TrbC/VirB2 family protein [Asaia spathodeae]GBR16753.1 conjugal transfer protein TrbC [Asaia spathodeae NBRC 105894]
MISKKAIANLRKAATYKKSLSLPFLPVILCGQAYAASSGGGSLPWETPLQTLTNSMSGPVAYSISIIAIGAAGATLVWGGEISEVTRRLVFLVLVISLIALATSAYSSLFASGAVF